MGKLNKRQYSENEELANTITHGVGIILGLTAGVWLLMLAGRSCDYWAIGSVLAYVICMLFSYIISTCYHACNEAKLKSTLRKLDHIAIYFHIAGTYTFFTLTVFRETAFWGWTLFFVVWVAAFTGACISYKGKGIGNRIETTCYVVMGLVVFIAFKPIIETLQPTGTLKILWYLIAGGISYICGAVFYMFKKVQYIHAIFHIFVLFGSVFHILAINSALALKQS